MSTKKLLWEEKYSVGVEEIDNQHKRMFSTINELLDTINTNSTEESLGHIIESLVEYKKFHFATEEKYFKEFNFDGEEEHIQKHEEFNDRLNQLKEKYPKYTIEFAFELIDFLEDWLINHLMVVDQTYVKCFHEHGLK
jgi:hemerythrin-like metal-binding protein